MSEYQQKYIVDFQLQRYHHLHHLLLHHQQNLLLKQLEYI
jgi:hypothetical protein